MIHPRRWRIVRRVRRLLGYPCLPGACIRSGQFGANCGCEYSFTVSGE